MFQITREDIENIKAKIIEDGLIPTIDELLIRVREKEDQFYDERDIYEVKKKEDEERKVDQAVEDNFRADIKSGKDDRDFSE